jgi:hypothetical protein
MSTTIGNLIDRVYREYLEPPDNVESYSYLTSGIRDSDTSISYDGNLFSVEEEDALDAGALIEVGRELMYTTALNSVSNTITVKRGQRGTTAAAHSANALIKIAPTFPRQSVFDAIKDQVENLYPTIYAIETKTVTAKTGINVLSGSTDNYLVAPVKAISQYTDFDAGQDQTTSQFRGVSVELVDLPNPFTYTDDAGASQTVTYTSGPSQVKAIQNYGITSGKTMYITFKKKFVVITAETDTLANIGLETEYEPIVMAGVAAQVVAGKDINKIDSAYITEQLNIANVPVGSSNTIRNALLQYQQLLLQQARKDLRARFPEPVTYNSINYSTT